MIFSSLLFLYLFLPLTLVGYYLAGKEIKNYWLLLASLIFFAWGGISFTLLLISSIALNYLFGLAIAKHIETKKGYIWLTVGVSTNILILGVFKYANFLIGNTNSLLSIFQLPLLPASHIALPVGISFYTFHSLSYLVDIYRRKTHAQRNFFDLSLYICMFSQLIAGPIIRYSDVWQQLRGRTHDKQKFTSGVERFLIGLGKKVLLANTFGVVADHIFTTDISSLNALNAWLGLVCYSLQIYYDFSGYSDMAIGLGRMFGFEFLENFNFPYMAKSVKEFWRRWHISLSSFFRDYVYIPLGGNRVKVHRTYLNLLFVFFLTGFWHGASWTFMLWGLFHGLFMLIERLGLERILTRIWGPIARLYMLIVVMLAWVLFRANNLHEAITYWKSLLHFRLTTNDIAQFMGYMNIELYITLTIGMVGALGGFNLLYTPLKRWTSPAQKGHKIIQYSYDIVSIVFFIGILLLCSMYLMANTYNPFIYYRF